MLPRVEREYKPRLYMYMYVYNEAYADDMRLRTSNAPLFLKRFNICLPPFYFFPFG